MFALARRLSLHQAIVVDDFSEHAPALRSELLGFPHWRPMTQTTPGPTPGTFSSRPRWSHQSGITTGHLDDRHDELPHTARFTAELLANAAALCALTAAGDHRGLRMDVNAMAYGVGGRLAPHDDHGHGKGRRVAWILYLTPPGDDWTAGDGGALRLISH